MDLMVISLLLASCPRGKLYEKSGVTMSGVLKRKYEELGDDSTYCSSSSCSPISSSASSGWESDEESSRGENKPSSALTPSFTPTSILKKTKRLKKNNVEFDRVTVFYFPRCQGFTSVPSRGGCTLGMVSKHSSSRQFTLAEFSKEQENVRREKLEEKLKEEKLEALKWKLTMNGTKESEEANQLTIDDISDDDIDVSNVDLEDGFFLQPYPAKKRRALLKAVGVKKIDKEEKRELHNIRLSREDCGCDCREVCDPETCSCSLAGIKCQMDHTSFPCGCTKDGCGNTEGRIEFNQARVQTHFIHTIMKLELEKQQQSSEKAAEAEPPFRERLPPLGCMAGKGSLEERAVPLAPAFQFSPDLEALGENSCSSDMTDSSISSHPSEDLEEPYESLPSDKSQSDVDDDGLARILHFNDSDAEEEGGRGQDDLSCFNPTDFFIEDHGGEAKPVPGHLSHLSECLDENANQDSGGLLEDAAHARLSSDSLDFFQSFSDYNLGPLYNSLKDFPQAGDQGSCFLESLIGLSESVPETPAPFTDNQLLEDAIKSSLMETVKV
ncbi:cysteine/serine-rich nuclear protein 1 [Patagioenas fasciata monilis]|uniref:Cysteine/serine-rich nuclear protein 1 n=1 Tax=Patagioenas fasciata monilis TaxID=372326 RepID=A0A1V4KLE6_PATFA|nr:cysteine/serine-rich nuclear protein 1 [Patagioenas fasciata monilis]